LLPVLVVVEPGVLLSEKLSYFPYSVDSNWASVKEGQRVVEEALYFLLAPPFSARPAKLV
jgi:hypothetical protein